ncbi:hypothetical protein HNR39_000704 [Glaciimonas immobilis]|uniref:Uncharacterized protein n=1 Tax=Glaciimonas immobilis TaxID=728004 RepID=A0A840RQ94_9BURK|nr:hypothetical protein [Glaciimonas immobilis]
MGCHSCSYQDLGKSPAATLRFLAPAWPDRRSSNLTNCLHRQVGKRVAETVFVSPIAYCFIYMVSRQIVKERGDTVNLVVVDSLIALLAGLAASQVLHATTSA